MKGNVVGQLILYLVFAVIVFMGVTSFTNKMMPPDASSLFGAIVAVVAFVILNLISLLLGLRKKKVKK